MGVLFWFIKMFAKVLKPFVKIALIEALMEALMGAEEATPTDAEAEEEG